MKIAYLPADEVADMVGDSFEEAIMSNPKKEIYSLEDFVTAFNNEQISDLGLIALMTEDNIIVHVSKGIASCDDPRVIIIDNDNNQ